MTERTITIRGPFTDADITEFWQTMQRIEAKNPTGRYSMVIDDPRRDPSTEDAFAAMDRVAPVAEGYARTHSYERRVDLGALSKLPMFKARKQ